MGTYWKLKNFPPFMYISIIPVSVSKILLFFSVHSVSSKLINSLGGHSVPSFSGKQWEGFSAWNFTKKFFQKGNGN